MSSAAPVIPTPVIMGPPSRPVVIANDNPRRQPLTNNEIRARLNRRVVTSTTMGGFRRTAGDVVDSGQANFYSPQLSTDFLEKPQNLRERRAFFRFFYQTNEIVAQAIDLHSTLPLSKLRLTPPKGKNPKQNEYVFKFFQDMCDNMKLFKTLIDIAFEHTLQGNAFSFAEEDDWLEDLSPEERAAQKSRAEQRSKFLKEKYGVIDKDILFKGWRKIVILPPDQVRVRKIPLSDDVAIEFVPDSETRRYLTAEAPLAGADPSANPKYSLPRDLQDKIKQSGVIPLDTDPYTGSHVYHLARKKSQYEPLGTSIIERCTNTLVLMDKLRQAQTSIASRHMTPMRIVWSEDLSDEDVENLREQVDMALVDPDFSIIANYEVHWEEMGSNGRLLDIESENTACMDRLFAGLGVTREILTGEGTYTGNRISLEIMNTQYLLFREIIQDYVENYLFKPVARKKGFIEYDEFGNEVLLYPHLSFSRLAIRDNDQFFNAAFQLYQKGSISVDLLLDILNIDPESTKVKLEHDMFTVNDSLFNEVLRNIYTNVATPLVEQTDLVDKLAAYMKLNKVEPVAEEKPTSGSARFSSDDPEKAKKLAKVMKYLAENPDVLNRIVSNA